MGEGTLAGASPAKDYRLVVPSLGYKPRQITVNGKKARGVAYDKSSGTLTVPVHIADVSKAVTVQLSR